MKERTNGPVRRLEVRGPKIQRAEALAWLRRAPRVATRPPRRERVMSWRGSLGHHADRRAAEQRERES